MPRVLPLLRRRPADELPPVLTDAGVASGASGAPVEQVVEQPGEPAETVDLSSPPLAQPGAVYVGGGDLVSLSHAHAATGNLHQAALAQWAADLQLVRPHLGERAAELCSTLESLSPLDPQSALAGARAALSSLIDEDVPVLALLGPTAHLSRRPGGSTTPRPVGVETPELPADLEAALATTLERSAERAGDTRRVSVSLRRSLLRQRSVRYGADGQTRLARGVLEHHERVAFDAELDRSAP